MSNSSIQVINTDSISFPIIKYHGVIHSQMVVGMNVLKDFLSSWTDFFGGSSKSYNNTINKLYHVVKSDLQAKAAALGGNFIIGYKIDIEEISGQGKAMMMITAMGTVVTVEKQSKSNDTPDNVSADDFQIAIDKQKLLKKIASITQIEAISDDDWRFLIENAVSESAEHILSLYLKSHDRLVSKGNLISLLSSIERDKSVDVLFSALGTDKDAHIIQLIHEGKFQDFSRLIDYISNDQQRISPS